MTFPRGFLWGAATSHFQVEGHPKEIAHRLSDWAQWTEEAGRISDNTTADQACQFYERFEQDLLLVKELNLNAFRISFNWPALLQDWRNSSHEKSRVLDPKQVEYYRRLLGALREQGITTFATLFHFTLPDFLAESGGWENSAVVDEFEHFARLCAEAFGDLVDYWITINEPLAYAYQSFISGLWPPGKKAEYLSAFRVIRNMLEGHARAYHAIKAVNQEAMISYTMHWRPFFPHNKFNPFDYIARHFRDYVFNHLFPEAVQTGVLRFPFPLSTNPFVAAIAGRVDGLKDTCDYLAINYYTRELSKFRFEWPLDLFGERSDKAEFATNDMGWEVFPNGLFDLLTRDTMPYQKDSKGRKRPIVITENGYAATFAAELTEGDWSLSDHTRISYLLAHLEAMHQAISAGVDVRGYLYWSLLDNFEWSEGLRARFGLVRVSYPTQERLLRESASVYGRIAKNNSVEIGNFMSVRGND
ncbi:MAG: glycoside hydrolase family 1 protein [Cyanobacteria bacterium SZAS TMP-1]|nr:glycoside hydrolase family 1 protein [Cyanobacteria bacterium SZAS TMP-1]